MPGKKQSDVAGGDSETPFTKSRPARSKKSISKRDCDAAEHITVVAKEETLELDVDKTIFDEFDPNDDSGLPLRTLINFTLSKKDDPSQLLTFDDIESNRGNVTLRGTLVEPLPLKWRETMVALLSTTSTDESSTSNSADIDVNFGDISNSESNKTPGETKLDWETLRVNDLVDGYCFQTYKWYEAKIVQYDDAKKQYKVHFQGWNSKFDEWIDKYSERLVPHKASLLLLKEAEKQAGFMLPWYQADDLQSRAASKIGKIILNRKQLDIVIEDVDDWCMDLTYANPTLWIISSLGIWYRVAGALCPGGHSNGNPSDPYKPFFQPTLEKYLASAHVAMAILDVFPSMPTANFQVITEEISSRTKGLMNELYILEHYKFVAEQLSSLQLPEGWSSKISIVKSVFMSQLMKEGDAFHSCGGMIALRNGTYKGVGIKKRKELIQDILLRESPPELISEPSNGKKKRKKSEEEENGGIEEEACHGDDSEHKKGGKLKEKELKLIFPVEDSSFWEYITTKFKNKPLTALPTPTNSLQLFEPFSCTLPRSSLYSIQEQFMKIYTVAANYRIGLQLPIFTASDLQEAFCSSLPDSDYKCDPNSSNKDFLLKELCIAMLEHVIEEKASNDGLETLFGMIVDNHGNVTESGRADDLNAGPGTNNSYSNELWLLPIVCKLRDRFRRLNTTSPSTFSAPSPAGENPSDLTYQAFLREGDAWEEVLRLLCERENLIKRGLSSSSSALTAFPSEDHILKCDQMLEEIATSFDMILLDGSAVVRLLRKRLLSGWYDTVEGYCHQLDEDENTSLSPLAAHNPTDAIIVNILQKQDYAYLPGQVVDVFHVSLKRWFEAIIIEREYIEDRLGNCRSEYYLVRYLGWGFESKERIPVETDRILPHKSASNEKLRRAMAPEELFAKYPNIYPNIAQDLWHYGNADDESDAGDMLTLRRNSTRSRHRGYVGFLEDLFGFIQSRLHLFKEIQEQEGGGYSDALNEARQLEEFYYNKVVKTFSWSPVSSISTSGPHVDNCDTLESARVYFPYEAWSMRSRDKENKNRKDHSLLSKVVTEEMDRSEDATVGLVALNHRSKSFASLSLIERIKLVHWLSCEFVDTTFAMNICQENMRLFPTKIEYNLNRLFGLHDPSTATTIDGEDDGDDDADIDIKLEVEAELDCGKMSRKRSLKNGTPATTEVPGTASKKRRGSTDVASSTVLSSSAGINDNKKYDFTSSSIPENDAQFEMSICTGRTEPLGKDRFGNMYWSYDHEVIQPAIYVEIRCRQSLVIHGKIVDMSELQAIPCWKIFSNPVDLQKLVEWLDEHGKDEAALLYNIIDWMIRQRVVLPSSIKSGLPSSTSTQSLSVIGENGENDSNAVGQNDLRGTITSQALKRAIIMRRKPRKNIDQHHFEVVSFCREQGFNFQYQSLCTSSSTDDIDSNKVRDKWEELRNNFIQKYENIKRNNFRNPNHLVHVTNTNTTTNTTTTNTTILSNSYFEIISIDFSGTDQQLGMGVKSTLHPPNNSPTNYVYVTSFKNDYCLAKKSGLLVSDRILYANGIRIDSVSSLQSMIKDFLTNKTENNCNISSNDDIKQDCVLVLIQRTIDINQVTSSIDIHFKELCEKDSDIQKAYDLQCQQLQQQQSSSSSSSLGLMNIHHAYYPLLQSLFTVLSQFDHPACCSVHWRKKIYPLALTKILSRVASLSQLQQTTRSSSSYSLLDKESLLLYQEVCSTLLDLETDLYIMGTIMLDLWMDPASRIRQQWRQLTSSSLFPERLAYTIAMLKAGVDWDLYHYLTIPLTIPSTMTTPSSSSSSSSSSSGYDLIMKTIFSESEEMKKLGKYFLLNTTILKEGTRVLYYGDGHIEANNDLNSYFMNFIGGDCHKRRTVLWGQQSSNTTMYPPFPGCVWLCQVKQVKLFNALIPFAQITLTVLPFTPLSASNTSGTSNNNNITTILAGSIPPIPKMLPYPNQNKLSLCRGIERILHIVKKINVTKQFQEPVDSEEYPEYYEVIKKPMDLNKIERKVNNLKYNSLNQFIDDMQLLHDNCLLFNGSEDKRYLPIAASMLEDVKTLCPCIFGEDSEEIIKLSSPNSLTDLNEVAENGENGVENDSEKVADQPSAKRSRRSFPPQSTSGANTGANGSNGSLATNSPSDLLISPQFSTITTVPPVKTFTVCMRLDKIHNQYIIEYDKYCTLIRKFAAVKPTPEVNRVIKSAVIEDIHPTKLPKGLLVGGKSLSSPPIPSDGSICFLPWRYLKIDWQDPTDAGHNPHVNLWDIDFLK